MQILYITFGFVDESLSQLITAKKYKSQDSESIRQILIYEEQWKELVSDLKLSSAIWEQFELHYAEDEVEVSQKEVKIVDGLIGGLKNSRRKMIELMINGYSNSALQKLEGHLREEGWKTVAVPMKLYRIAGEVIYGKQFTKGSYFLIQTYRKQR